MNPINKVLIELLTKEMAEASQTSISFDARPNLAHFFLNHTYCLDYRLGERYRSLQTIIYLPRVCLHGALQ